MNLYAYTGDNPVNRLDPSGHGWSWIGAVAGAVAGAIVATAIVVAIPRGSRTHLRACADWRRCDWHSGRCSRGGSCRGKLASECDRNRSDSRRSPGRGRNQPGRNASRHFRAWPCGCLRSHRRADRSQISDHEPAAAQCPLEGIPPVRPPLNPTVRGMSEEALRQLLRRLGQSEAQIERNDEPLAERRYFRRDLRVRRLLLPLPPPGGPQLSGPPLPPTVQMGIIPFLSLFSQPGGPDSSTCPQIRLQEAPFESDWSSYPDVMSSSILPPIPLARANSPLNASRKPRACEQYSVLSFQTVWKRYQCKSG